MHYTEVVIHNVTTSSTSQFITCTIAARLSGWESTTTTPLGSDSFSSWDTPRLKLGIANCGKSCILSREPTKCFLIASISIRSPSNLYVSWKSTRVQLFDFLGLSLMRASLNDSAATFLTLLSGLRAPGINSSNSVITSASHRLLVIIKSVAAWLSRKRAWWKQSILIVRRMCHITWKRRMKAEEVQFLCFFVSRNNKIN